MKRMVKQRRRKQNSKIKWPRLEADKPGQSLLEKRKLYEKRSVELLLRYCSVHAAIHEEQAAIIESSSQWNQVG
jgi:hypothetical protein